MFSAGFTTRGFDRERCIHLNRVGVRHILANVEMVLLTFLETDAANPGTPAAPTD